MAEARPPEDLMDRVNFIWRFFEDPCDAPLTVYAEALKPAALKFFINYYMPDWQNILTNWARPGRSLFWPRRRRKTRRGNRRGRWGFTNWLWRLLGWQADDLLATFLPGFDENQGRQASFKSIVFWTYFGLLERVNFWFFVADLTTTFFWEWQTAVMESRYCEAERLMIIYRTVGANVLVPLFAWNPISPSTTEKIRGNVLAVPGGAFIGATGLTSCAVEITVHNAGVFPATVGIRILMNGVPQQEQIVGIGAGQSVSLGAHAARIGPTTYICEAICNLQFIDQDEGFICVQGEDNWRNP